MKHVALPIIETRTSQTYDEENVAVQRWGVFPAYQVVNFTVGGIDVGFIAEPGVVPLHKRPGLLYRSVIPLTSDRAAARAAAEVADEIPREATVGAPRRTDRPWETVTDAMRRA